MNYAINLKSKSHRILKKGDSPAPYETVVIGDADGWIGWKGGKCPLPDYVIADVKLYPRGNATGVAHGFWWGTTEGLSGTIIAYRPILNAEEKEMNQEWKPEAGAKAQTSGGECEILAVDNERGMASVRWNDGELGTVRIACVKPLPTDRDRWIDAALDCDCEPREGMLSRRDFCGALYDAGLAKLPEQK